MPFLIGHFEEGFPNLKVLGLMKFHYISLGNLNFGRGLHNRDKMLLESFANQSMRAWKLNWFAVTSRACCPPLQRLQSHLPSHLAKPSDTVSTSFQNGSRNQRSTRHVRHLRLVLEMLHYDPTSGTVSNASGSSLGQWKVITSHWQISWRSVESCWWFFHNHFYKSLFEDATSKGLTDLPCLVGGFRTPQMPTAARQWHSEGQDLDSLKRFDPTQGINISWVGIC